MQPRTQLVVFRHHRLIFQRLLHLDAQPFEINRLGQIIVGAQAHRLDRVFDGAERGHQNEQRVAAALADLRQQFQAAQRPAF